MSVPACERLFFISLLATILFSCPGILAQQGVSSESRDHPLIERFAGSAIVGYSTEQDVNYQLVLGNMRRTTGQVVAERSQRLRGDLTRITYEAPQGFTGAEIAAFFQAQAEGKGYSELFRCTGRGCGNSNYWANDVFQDRSLYGPERNQHYLALQLKSEEASQSYAAVYVITRTNRRLLVRVDVLETVNDEDVPAAGISVEALLRNGALQIPGISFGSQDRMIDTGQLDQIVRLLQSNESIQLYIVAHLRDQDSFDNLMARTLQRAEQVREELIRRGVDGSRLVAQGVGPLAPLCTEGNCAERVELVMRLED